MTESNKPISPLRQRMVDDMTLGKLSPSLPQLFRAWWHQGQNHQLSGVPQCHDR